MAEEKSYYVVDPGGRYRCLKCGVPLVKGDAVFGYLDNAFPVELPVCPKCGFVLRAGGAGHGQGALGGEGAGGQMTARHPGGEAAGAAACGNGGHYTALPQ